jgi:hypothetical protein
LRYAIALRERLPRLAEVLARGAIDLRLMAAVVHRTELVGDPELIAELDAAVARHAPRWMRLSAPKAVERIDMWVARFDPAGLRRIAIAQRIARCGPSNINFSPQHR